MKILFAGAYDWANVSNRVARGINAAAGRQIARVLTVGGPHPFGYEEDRLSWAEAAAWARDVTWLISTGDGDYTTLRTIIDRLALPNGLRVATAHVGSAYRTAYEVYNIADHNIGFDRRFIGGDLYRFAADDPRAVPYFAPPHQVTETIEPLDVARIAHSPSSRAVKGTAEVLAALVDLDVDILEGLTFDECARRRARCAIFVDQINDLGGYGASAVEALSVGCVTLGSTKHIHPHVANFYPAPPIIDVTPQTLRAEVDALLSNRTELAELRQASHQWALACASPTAVGNYWLRYLS